MSLKGRLNCGTAAAMSLRRPPAFTLIELLVVIAVISILLTLLMPSLKSARDMAKSTACISIQKQMALLTGMYLQDNRMFYPSCNYASGRYDNMQNGISIYLPAKYHNWNGTCLFFMGSSSGGLGCPSNTTKYWVYGMNFNVNHQNAQAVASSVKTICCTGNSSFAFWPHCGTDSLKTQLAPWHQNGYIALCNDGRVIKCKWAALNANDAEWDLPWWTDGKGDGN